MSYQVMPFNWVVRIQRALSVTDQELSQEAIEDYGLVPVADLYVRKLIPSYASLMGTTQEDFLFSAAVYYAAYLIAKTGTLQNSQFKEVKTMDISWKRGVADSSQVAANMLDQFYIFLGMIDLVEVSYESIGSESIILPGANTGREPIGGTG